MTPLRQWMTEDMQLRGLAPATQQAYLRYAALQQLAQDPRFLGGQMGMLGVLQTWTRDLRDHPHVHYLVPALALAPDGTRWLVGKSAFLLHVKPLGERVEGEGPRGGVPDAMGGLGQRACLGQAMDRRLPTRRQWRECLNVSRPLDLPPCAEQQPPRGGRKWGGHVRYTEGKNGCAETGHAAPRHLHRTVSCARTAERVVKGRAYGLLRPRKRPLLAEVRRILALGQAAPPPPRAAAAPEPLVATPERAVGRCPSCGQPMQLVQTLPPQRHHQVLTNVGEPSSRDPPLPEGGALSSVTSVPGPLGAPGRWCASQQRSPPPLAPLCLLVARTGQGADARIQVPAARSAIICDRASEREGQAQS